MSKQLIIVLTVVISSALITGWFYETLRRVVPVKNQFTEVVDFLNSDTASYDVVFIGSSRVVVHVDPRIIDSVCGVNSVVVAMHGTTIVEQFAVLKKYLQRHRAPKLIVLGLDYTTLHTAILPYNYPEYYDVLKDPVLGPILSNEFYRFKYKFLFEWYDVLIEYSTKTDYQKYAALISGFGSSRKFEHLNEEAEWISTNPRYKGFRGIDRAWDTEADEMMKTPGKIIYDERGLQFLSDFISTAHQCGADMVTIFTPGFNYGKMRTPEVAAYSDKLVSITNKYHVPFWDYRNDSLSYNKELYYNPDHMKKIGAELFSMELAKDLKNFKASQQQRQ